MTRNNQYDKNYKSISYEGGRQKSIPQNSMFVALKTCSFFHYLSFILMVIHNFMWKKLKLSGEPTVRPFRNLKIFKIYPALSPITHYFQNRSSEYTSYCCRFESKIFSVNPHNPRRKKITRRTKWQRWNIARAPRACSRKNFSRLRKDLWKSR